MGASDGEPGRQFERPTESDERVVTAHRCTTDRFVFVEEGNTDAWIASDLTVCLDS